MIIVGIHRNANNEIVQYEVRGHANAGEYGQDIVCSAVSVLAQTTLLGLNEIAKIRTTYEIKSGFVSCQLPDSISQEERHQANLLLETMVLGIKNLTLGYSEYIKLHDKEV